MPKITKRFTDEQIERANRVDVVEYARSNGLEIQKSGQWYKAKHMGGLYFNKNANTWHWETQDCGGTGAISLCMKLEDLEWKDAVRRLLGEEMAAIRHPDEWVPAEEVKREFVLPEKADNFRHVYAYLCKTRGIEKSIVDQVVKQGLLYENTQKSCVFVGQDAEGIPRHASVRSTNTIGNVFKQDVPGSQKMYSFSLSGDSGILNVFEAPIDVLSYMSLQKLHGIDSRDSFLSLGGVSDKALEYFLSTHDNIHHIRVCSDHDEAGEGCANRIYKRWKEEYKVTRHRPKLKDFNEDLVAYREKQQNQQQERLSKKEPESGYYEKGTNSTVIICDSVQEIQAYQGYECNVYQQRFQEQYKNQSHFLEFKSMEQLKVFFQEHPEIDSIYIAVSRTDTGNEIAKQITEKFSDHICERTRPFMNSNQEDLCSFQKCQAAIENAVEMEEPDMELVM